MNFIHAKKVITMKQSPTTLLNKMDLNLLRLFIIIYQQQSLTKTAEQLHLSQSAISHALNRLRQTLNDELFYKQKGKLYPTTYAQHLYPNISAIFQQLQQTFSPILPLNDQQMLLMAQNHFQKITIAMHDEVELIVFDKIYLGLSQLLPNCQIVSSRLNRTHLSHELHVGKVDFAFDVGMTVSEDIEQKQLFTDQWVVAFFNANLQQPILTPHDYLNSKHITVSSRRTGYSLEDSLLAQLGLKRDIKVRCQHFTTACQLLSQGHLLLTLPSQVAYTLIPKLNGWHIVALPFDLPNIAIHGYWHNQMTNDALHQWLRNQLIQLLK